MRDERGESTKVLSERPVLWSASSPYWRAWEVLHAQRSSGFAGPGPIRFEAVQAWFSARGIEGSEADEYERYLRSMDAEYLDWCAKRTKDSTPAGHRKVTG